LRDLLEYHELGYGSEALDEGVVFGLAGGLGFNFLEAEEFDPPVLIGRAPALEEDACRHLGIDLDSRTTDDPEEAWRWLRDELDASRPTMVYADIKELDYLDVQLHNSHHDVVVVGYEPDGRRVLVADHDRDGLEYCSLESLRRARASEGFPGPARHRTWIMRFPARLPELRVAVAAAVETSIANMTRPQIADERAGISAGLEGVAHFAETFADWPRIFSDLRRALKRLRIYVALAGTGGSLFRSLQAGFLTFAARRLGDPGLGRSARIYDELAAAWSALAAKRDDDPARTHRSLQPLVRRISALEHEGVEEMRKWLEAARGESTITTERAFA
jgi:hypothetical protein